MNPLDFIEAPEGVDDPAAMPDADAAPPAEAAPQAEPAPSDGPPRGPDGKFAPKEPAEPEVTRVPLGELLNEREKRQAAEKRAAELEARIPAQPATPPDPIMDPEGHEAWRDQQQESRFQQIEDARINDKLNFSERIARKEHGAEALDEAKKWGLGIAAQDPAFAQAVLQHPDPYEFIVTEFQRSQTLAALQNPDTLAQFKAWQAAQAGQEPPAAAPAAHTPTPPRSPTRSIAGAPAAGAGKPGETPAGPGNAFMSAISG